MRDNVKGGALTETTFFIMLSLYEPRHGYGINKMIEEKTSGRLSLGAGTLYKALDTLVNKKWIVPCEGNNQKKNYIITEEGKKIVEIEKKRLRQVIKIANSITGGENDG